jgi:hypothetical protein
MPKPQVLVEPVKLASNFSYSTILIAFVLLILMYFCYKLYNSSKRSTEELETLKTKYDKSIFDLNRTVRFLIPQKEPEVKKPEVKKPEVKKPEVKIPEVLKETDVLGDSEEKKPEEKKPEESLDDIDDIDEPRIVELKDKN